jgi:hypothetical protein
MQCALPSLTKGCDVLANTLNHLLINVLPAVRDYEEPRGCGNCIEAGPGAVVVFAVQVTALPESNRSRLDH